MSTAVAEANAAQSLIDSINGPAKKVTKDKTEEAQERFLKLLTTQLQNQDPLNPMDNAQMTSQFAQISTVEGIEKLNQTLQKVMNSTIDAEAMQAASMVGHEVMVSGNGLELTEAGAVSGLELPEAADLVKVTISDSSGSPVRTLTLADLGPGMHNFTWDGMSDAGAKAVAGNYRLSFEATRGEDRVSATGLELASVVSVTRGTTGTSIDLGRLGRHSMSDIKQIF